MVLWQHLLHGTVAATGSQPSFIALVDVPYDLRYIRKWGLRGTQFSWLGSTIVSETDLLPIPCRYGYLGIHKCTTKVIYPL